MMDSASTIPVPDARDRSDRGLADTLRYAMVATRPRRVFSLLVMLWMLNIFDLSYTILAHQIGGFVEMNPFARGLLHPSWGLVAFKLTTVTLGTGIMLALRRRAMTEIVCWAMCIIYTVLAFVWMTYFSIIR